MEVPLVTITDVANITKIGLKKALQFARQFQQYRINLSHNSWSCLTSFYPRANYITYYYVLFWWADYCGVKNELIEDPDRSLIAELFFKYIVEIDRIIDKPEGDKFLKKPSLIKSALTVDRLLKKMCNHIEVSPHLISPVKRSLYHEIWKYRQECLEICQHVANQTDICLDCTLFFKEVTTGGLFRVWAYILANLYCDDPSHEMVISSQNILIEACMAMQIVEDLLDFPEDYNAGTLNIFHEILKVNPDELSEAEAYLDGSKWQHLDFIWAEQHLPVSFQTIFELSHRYLQKAMKVSSNPYLIGELCKFIGSIPTHPLV
jgi:hypothetical protein